MNFDSVGQFVSIVPFETVYFDENGIHFSYEHFLRFKRAFWILGREFNLTFDKFEKELKSFISQSRVNFGAVRFVFIQDRLWFELKDIRYTNELFSRGMSLKIARVKKDKNNLLNYIKTNNIGINSVEEEFAKKKGYDSCLFLNQDSIVTEAAFANIFFRKDNVIYTPHVLCGLLPGIMRKYIANVCQKHGFRVEKCFISINDLKEMEECFITSSVAGVFPVSKIEDFEFKSRGFLYEILKDDMLKRPWIK